MIVPVSHAPDQAAQNVMWNPYQAEDEMTRLNESQQLVSSNSYDHIDSYL